MTGVITRDRVTELLAQLNDAGERWRAIADAAPEVILVVTDDPEFRDHLVLGEYVQHSGDQPTWTYPVRLYWSEHEGRWRPTTWSNVGQDRHRRPPGMVYDPDAGVHVQADDEDLPIYPTGHGPGAIA